MTFIRSGVLLVIVAGFLWVMMALPDRHAPTFIMPTVSAPADNAPPVMEAAFISGELTPEVHAATAVELNNGDIRVFWYGGQREGSRDTSIYSRVLHQSDNSWSDVSEIMTRETVLRDTRRYIRKLGNAVAVVQGDRLLLFFVSVSVGGWAGSAINLSVSEDNGASWGPVKRLISTPFMNISTLVRNAPLLAENGDILLPDYHEFLGKFSELLQLDASGNVIDKYRISHGGEAIQPAVLAVDAGHAIAFMRNTSDRQGGRIWFSQNEDTLSDWQSLTALPLPNPDSAVSVTQLNATDELLMVFNNHDSERDDMTMAYRPDSQADWRLIHEFEKVAHGTDVHNPFSYPFLLKTREGNFHLVYTWKRQYIKHVYFNNAALQAMLQSTGPDL